MGVAGVDFEQRTKESVAVVAATGWLLHATAITAAHLDKESLSSLVQAGVAASISTTALPVLPAAVVKQQQQQQQVL